MNNSLSPSLGPEHGKALRNGERETKIDLNKVKGRAGHFKIFSTMESNTNPLQYQGQCER